MKKRNGFPRTPGDDMASASESDVVQSLRAARPALIRHRSLHDPIRRGVALVVAISVHLVVLIPMVWPAIRERGDSPVEDNPLYAIHIRFFRSPPPPSTRAAVSPPLVITPASPAGTTSSTQPLKPPAARYAAPLPTEKPSSSVPAASTPVTGNERSISDGGFQERLLRAQHSYAVHGVPGSDKPWVPGIRLIDPSKQGVGAVMRQAQRLFGVTDRHCVDVDVWRNMTPRELIARHISPNDVDRADEKYQCNRPLGLSF
jgi:hypothetical protein